MISLTFGTLYSDKVAPTFYNKFRHLEGKNASYVATEVSMKLGDI